MEALSPSLLLTGTTVLCILELRLDFETNIQVNSIMNANKYNALIKDLSFTYNIVPSFNLFIAALRILGSSCFSFLSSLQDLTFDKAMQRRISTKQLILLLGLHTVSFVKEISRGSTPNF